MVGHDTKCQRDTFGSYQNDGVIKGHLVRAVCLARIQRFATPVEMGSYLYYPGLIET
jgi:hypothetical protein